MFKGGENNDSYHLHRWHLLLLPDSILSAVYIFTQYSQQPYEVGKLRCLEGIHLSQATDFVSERAGLLTSLVTELALLITDINSLSKRIKTMSINTI